VEKIEAEMPHLSSPKEREMEEIEVKIIAKNRLSIR
jgi:hypothetical protein